MSAARKRVSPHSAGSLHLILHAPRTQTLASLQRPGQAKGTDKPVLYSLQKCQLFALRLLLNIDFTTQIGSFGHLGLSIGCTDSSTWAEIG